MAEQFVVEFDTGKFMAIVYSGSRPLAVAVDERSQALSWPSRIAAVIVANRLLPEMNWRVSGPHP